MNEERISNEELRGFGIKRLRELETELRRSMAMARMQLFGEEASMVAKRRRQRKDLARVMTFITAARQNGEEGRA